MNGRWGLPLDSKYKPRGRGNGFFGYGNEIQDGFSELNRGPRAGRSKNQKAAGPAPVVDLKGQNLSSVGNENSSVALDREQYNRDDFPDKYSDAKFFVIKSYSEDDIHKSIKYNVWTSTPNGNKKLDGGYQEAQAKDGGCPIWTGKASHAPTEDEREGTNGKPSLQSVSVLTKESAQGSPGEINTPEELGVAAAAGASLKVLKPAAERHVAIGVA
ncbi:hypothetical protein GW17_00008154 [Ensete ventricosum]|nr:hypothetical protein GW17_00008154 [Ensete ventricosum]RZR81668.1 hypothetical protein BHM03_00007949 [Ensete ventricosum]